MLIARPRRGPEDAPMPDAQSVAPAPAAEAALGPLGDVSAKFNDVVVIKAVNDQIFEFIFYCVYVLCGICFVLCVICYMCQRMCFPKKTRHVGWLISFGCLPTKAVWLTPTPQ